MRKITTTTYFIVTFLAVFMVGYWLLVMPEARLVGEKMTELNAESKSSVLGSKDSSSGVTVASEVDKELAMLLLPTDSKQYDLAVQIEGLAKNMEVPLNSMTVSDKDPDLGAKTTAATSDDGSGSAGAGSSDSSTGSSFSSAVATSTMQKLTVTLGITTSYTTMQSFVREVCRLNRLIEVNQVNVSGSADKVTAQITLYAFYLP